MATKMKYQNTNPIDKLREGEMYFFLRAQDKIAPIAVKAYADALKAESERQTDPEISNRLFKAALECLRFSGAMSDWQYEHPEFVKLPD